MSSNKLRRQFFQIRNGGFGALIQKSRLIREVLARIDSRLLGQYRLRGKLLRIEPLLAPIINSKSIGESDQDDQIDILVSKARVLRDQNQLLAASQLLDSAQNDFPESLKVLKNKAQIEFVRGNWKGFCNTLSAVSALSDRLLAGVEGSDTRVRLLGSDWTGPLGHIVHLAAIIKLERLGALSNEKRILLYDPRFVANKCLLNLFLPMVDSIKASRIDIERLTQQFPALFDDVTTFRLRDRVLDQWSAIDAANVGWIEQNKAPPVSYTHLTLPTNREV